MTTTITPVVGTTMTVTRREGAQHYFADGTRVRVLQDNADRHGPAHRWLCRGTSDHPKSRGTVIVQWLAAEDLTR